MQTDGRGGDAITLSGHALRSHAFRLLDNGFGSGEPKLRQREFTQLVATIAAGGTAVHPHPFPPAEAKKARPQRHTRRTHRHHPWKPASLTPGTFAPGVRGLLIRAAAEQ
ncbi:hypothetical protein [Kitasatospora sp. NPDC007106]|uniref:hypothetical protein n=1 Tax=Kitasatospora sp. NPDC007106 TaxID=3156914 RepID=UPI0033DF08A0